MTDRVSPGRLVGMLTWQPDTEVTTPDAVRVIAGERPVRPVWRNVLGGLTYEVGVGDGRVFVKWAPRGTEVDLAAEVNRLRWATYYISVPTVLEVGGDRTGTWIVTSALPGTSAVHDRWADDPAVAVRAIGAGLRALHDALPVNQCRYTRSLGEQLVAVEAAAASGDLHPGRWHPEHQHLSVDEAVRRVLDAPSIDHLVVCHGDACAPNTIVGDDGSCTGHVDLGSLGIADRWADLAIATWSVGWNFGPGWDDELLEAYGIEADPERTAYYRLLWDLSS
jgi:kanamycin kinase